MTREQDNPRARILAVIKANRQAGESEEVLARDLTTLFRTLSSPSDETREQLVKKLRQEAHDLANRVEAREVMERVADLITSLTRTAEPREDVVERAGAREQPWWETAIRDHEAKWGPSGSSWNISAVLDCLRQAKARAALSALPAQGEMQPSEAWRPIETAPRDGDDILVMGTEDFGGRTCLVVSWDNSPPSAALHWATLDGLHYHEAAFEYWQPLPTPPAMRARASQQDEKPS